MARVIAIRGKLQVAPNSKVTIRLGAGQRDKSEESGGPCTTPFCKVRWNVSALIPSAFFLINRRHQCTQ